MVEDYLDDESRWRKFAWEQRYGKGSWDSEIEGKKSDIPSGLVPYDPEVKRYWDQDKGIGLLERDGSFIGIACLVAKEVVEKESFVRRFGLSFEKDIQWHAISSLLDHLARNPMFKAVLVTTSKIPFKLESDVPEELEGRLRWAQRNFNFHKEKANVLRIELEKQGTSFVGYQPPWLPKQMKEEEQHARAFEDTIAGIESKINEHLKPYFLVKDNLFAAALFFYIYTDAKPDADTALQEIESRKYSAKMEILKTYFVKCDDVKTL